jgi:hypothetical protein
MPLIDATNPNENWFQVLELWGRVANWVHYKPSERALKDEMKLFLVALWSEKDWLKEQYPSKKKAVEQFINKSRYLPIVADLANTAKHRKLTRGRRSTASQTSIFGRIEVGSAATRRLHFIRLADGTHIELMHVLRSALDEMESFRLALRAGKV